jgi:hypothetical protein
MSAATFAAFSGVGDYFSRRRIEDTNSENGDVDDRARRCTALCAASEKPEPLFADVRAIDVQNK